MEKIKQDTQNLIPNKIKKGNFKKFILQIRNVFNLEIRRNKEIIKICSPYSMISDYSLSRLISLVGVVNKEKISGALVECGVWKGGACMAMALAQMKYSEEYRDIWLYDTFNGMTMPALENDGLKAERKYEDIKSGKHIDRYDKWHNQYKWIYCPINIVKKNINSTDYPVEKLKFIKGDINKTLDSTTPSKIAILRLDTDWYQSTKKELDTLSPMLSVGGFIIIDDYYAWQGSKKATDEFLAENPTAFKIVDKCAPEPLILRKIL
ncbi:MAG: TylF/MycF/NovP-related O-methyltransferase [Candidatus Paceibacterota bacterium]